MFAADLHEALERLGAEVRTVALEAASSAVDLGFDVMGPRRRSARTLSSLRRAIRESSVVVGHGSTTLPMCALASTGSRVPFVYRQISQQQFWANTPARRVRTRLALRATTHVTALWAGAADTLTECFGVEPDRISIVPNGVPVDRCPAVDESRRRAAKRSMGVDLDRPVLLSIGALVPEKGVDILVEAMRNPPLRGWQLLIVGRGPEEGRLRGMAGSYDGRVVVFHEPVSSGAEAIAAADVLALTSRGGDSMPAVLIEAGMMGVPSVATPVEGIVDIVLDGHTGRLVPLDDPGATAEAVADVFETRDQFGSQAAEHCRQRFEIGSVAKRWLAVLDYARVSS